MTTVRFARPKDRTLQLIVTGTGRSGTGFASKWLTSIGVPSGHEAFFSYQGLQHAIHMLATRNYHLIGECSWLATPCLVDSAPLRDALVIHQVRHPKKMIESCMRVPLSASPHYARYMERYLPAMAGYTNELDKSVCRWVYWNRMIEDATKDRESYFWRVEDGTGGLLNWLEEHELVDVEKIIPAQVFSNTQYNHKSGSRKTARLEDVHPNLLEPLQEQMEKYGYKVAK